MIMSKRAKREELIVMNSEISKLRPFSNPVISGKSYKHRLNEKLVESLNG
jgi:hypothetical protein